MSDTITTMTTRMMRSDVNVALPVGTRLRCVTLEGSSTLQGYVGSIATVVSHNPGHPPLVKFPLYRQGDNNWYITAWNVLPVEGQRVTIVECMDAAQDNFKDYATGRQVTYVSTDDRGKHIVRFDAVPNPDFPNPATVEHLDFVLGAEVPVADLTSSEPALIVDTATSIEQRDRAARDKYDALVEAINDLAEREEWCGNFEEWAQENDVPVRRSQEKEFSVTIDLTYEIDEDTILSAFQSQFRGDHDEVVTNDTVTVTSTVSIHVTTTEDTPHDMDSYEIESALRNDGYSDWNEWEITGYDESY